MPAEPTFEEARAQFPVLERLAYLRPQRRPARSADHQAMQEAEERGLLEGRGAAAQFQRLLALREELRGDVAAFVGVDPELVALTASTTDGCNIVIAGLELERGDEVITTTDEHFGLLGPLHTSGATVVVAEPDPERILAAVTPRTRLLALSTFSGRPARCFSACARGGNRPADLVDGAQSVGAIAVDLDGLDYYTVSGQKWLCGPEGTGALVVAEPDALRVGRPSYLSQQRHEPDGTFEPRSGARRFEPNLIARGATAGFQAAIRALPDWRFEKAKQMAERCRELLQAAGADVVVPAKRATLVSWRVPAEASASIVAGLAEAGVIVRDLPGRGLVRASVGWWTSDEDLERLVAGL
jgi:L-cysteine/cystine lyase